MVALRGLSNWGTELRGPYDRAGDKVGEEGHEQGEVQERSHGLAFLFKHIDGVAERRERIEGYACRQNDIWFCRMEVDADEIEDGDEIVQQKGPVFEETEHPEVADEADYEQEAFLMNIRLCIQCATHKEIDHGRQP
ncbi:hypothetical protein ACQ86N_08510 [Puia sp. P3]|uniref:hypothetical protein n=1 Tax=Puia sp. P3 TaxID=3423952 RepID=UPI003D66BBE4